MTVTLTCVLWADAALPPEGAAVTVTVYVPVFAVGTDEPLPLHPVSTMPVDSRRPIMSSASVLMRFRRPKKAKAPNNAAKLAAAGGSQGFVEGFNAARVPAVVTTRVAVELWPPESVTLPGLTRQELSIGRPEQVSVTAPLNVAFAARFRVTVPVEVVTR